jgi:hypothetical protein
MTTAPTYTSGVPLARTATTLLVKPLDPHESAMRSLLRAEANLHALDDAPQTPFRNRHLKAACGALRTAQAYLRQHGRGAA